MMRLRTSIAVLLLLGFLAPFFPGPAAGTPAQPKPMSLADGICMNKAQESFGKGDTEKAIQTLSACIGKEPSPRHHPYLYFTLGNYYAGGDRKEKKQDLIKAEAAYNKAVEIFPEFLDAWLNLGAVRYEADRFKEAARAFETAYRLSDPKKGAHLYHAAVCRFQARESGQALALYAALFKAHPDEILPEWREVLVNILFTLDRHREALPEIEALAGFSWPPGQLNRRKKWQEILVGQYLGLDMDGKAESFARYLTRTDPLEPKWWKALSHVHLKQNRLAGGLTALVIYGFLAPLTPEERQLTADLYLALGIPHKAAETYESLVREAPGPGTVKKLIQARAMAHDPDSALAWIEKGLAQGGKGTDRDDLVKLKHQLEQLRQFFAAADPVLSP